MDTKHAWPPDHVDHENYPRLTEFKSEIERETVRERFTDVGDFRAKLMDSLIRWRQRHQTAPAGPVRRGPGAGHLGHPPETERRNELIWLRLRCDETPLHVLLDCYRGAVGAAAILDGLTDASAIVDKLGDLTPGPTAIAPILRFAMWLERRATTKSRRTELRTWVDGAARRQQLDGVIIAGERAAIGRRLKSRRPGDRLLVCIDDQQVVHARARYSLVVELHRGGGVEPLSAGDDDRTYDLDEVRTIVCGSIIGWTGSCEPSELVVEFLVPRDLLGEVFDRWPVEDPASVWTPLGVLYGVLVRDLDRTRAKEPSPEWRRRWALLNASERPAQVHWVDPREVVTVSSFRASLLREENRNWVCLAFPRYSGDEAARRLLTTGLDMGAPAMVWLRTDEPASNRTAEELRQHLSGTPLPRLPAKLFDLRREAEQDAETDHCGRSLALLWDDPDRVPPPDRPLAAPTPKD